MIMGNGTDNGPNRGWSPHIIRHFNGSEDIRYLGSKYQMVSKSWGRQVFGPAIEYIPEKDRLVMLIYCDRRADGLRHSMLSVSDDRGETWSEPKYIHTDADGLPCGGGGIVLTYLGGGKMLFSASLSDENLTWFSYDYGETWDESRAWEPSADGKILYTWCRAFVDKDPATGRTERIMIGGYIPRGDVSCGGYKISCDEGKTWDIIEVPGWKGFNEIGFVRAANGDLVAALRTDGPERYRNIFDHFSGMGISISTDNGYTWSEVKILYDWGRHHTDIVLMPDGTLVLTYVVRLGYPYTDEGYPQWGIEAVTSTDNGRSWDLDHRYILETWAGQWGGPGAWLAGSQQTSSLLMPDGSIYTVFGTGAGAKALKPPMYSSAMNIGLISWKPDDKKTNSDDSISSSPDRSDKRNNFDPDPGHTANTAGIKGYPNIALKEFGAEVKTSASDSVPSDILYDRYPRPAVWLETVPGWIEMSWPEEHVIDTIRILPGIPGSVDTPKTECTPLDYRLQYKKDGIWTDLILPVTDAQTASDFVKENGIYLLLEKDFEYIHRFPGIKTDSIRLYITRTSDIGMRVDKQTAFPVPENKRKTAIRRIEVLEAAGY
jgi:hypothetical protein